MPVIRNPDGSYTDTDTGQTVNADGTAPAAPDQNVTYDTALGVASAATNLVVPAVHAFQDFNPVATVGDAVGEAAQFGGDLARDPLGTVREVLTDAGSPVVHAWKDARSEANPLPDGAAGTENTPHDPVYDRGGALAPPKLGGGKALEKDLSSTFQDPYQQDTQAAQGEAIRLHREAAMADMLTLAQDKNLSGQEYDNIVTALGSEDVFKMHADVQRMYGENMAKLADVDQRFLTLAGKSVDPGRIYHNGGAATVAMSAAVGALSQALLGPGAPNTALNIINNAIDRDVRAQEVNLQNEGNSLRGSLSTLAQINQTIGDKQIALAKTREILRADITARVNAQAAKTKSEILFNNGKYLAQMQDVELMKARDSYAGLVNTHTLKQYANGPAAGIAQAEKLRQASFARTSQFTQPMASGQPGTQALDSQAPIQGEAPQTAVAPQPTQSTGAVAPTRAATRPAGMPKQAVQKQASAPQGSYAMSPSGPLEIQNIDGKEFGVDRNGVRSPIIHKPDGTKIAVVGIGDKAGVTNPSVWHRFVKNDEDLAKAMEHPEKGLGRAITEIEHAPGQYKKLATIRSKMRAFYEKNKGSWKLNSSLNGTNPAAYELKEILAPLMVDAAMAFKTESGGDSRFSEGEYKLIEAGSNLAGADDLFMSPTRVKQLLGVIEGKPEEYLSKVKQQGDLYGVGFMPGLEPKEAETDGANAKLTDRKIVPGGGTK
jgi:hypothetical protein